MLNGRDKCKVVSFERQPCRNSGPIEYPIAHFLPTCIIPFFHDHLIRGIADNPYLLGTKARTLLLPPALDAAGLPGIPYTSYHEIAAMMLPDEIHPEVKEKLDAIQRAFSL